MIVLCSNSFKSSYHTLLKHKKFYACITKRVKEDFLELQKCNEIKGSILQMNSNKTLFKARLMSCNNNGKSYGFRAIILCDKSNSTLYCLGIYPKYGKLNKSTLSRVELAQLLQDFKSDKENNELMGVKWSAEKKMLVFSVVIK